MRKHTLTATPSDVVLVDPWLGAPNCPDSAKELGKVDAICLTHGHFDHVGDTLAIAAEKGCKVVAIHEVATWLGAQGLQKDLAVGMNKGGTFKITDSISVTMCSAVHSSGCGSDELAPGGEAASFVLNVDGTKIYHTGDTCAFGDQQIINDLHSPSIGLMCIGGHYTQGPEECAYSLAKFLTSIRHVIPMHYGTFPALAGTPDELTEAGKSKWQNSAQVHALKPGESIELEKLQ